MFWLTAHMWLILLGAFLLGLFLGWWIWRCRDNLSPQVAETGTSAQNFVAPTSSASSEPVPAPKPTGVAPHLYTAPTDGPADDLKKVKGIGPGIEKLLYSTGIYYYKQIAEWTDDHVTWIDHKLQFPGRITRENWISQAKTLRDGGSTEFAERYEKGETPSSYVDGEKKSDS